MVQRVQLPSWACPASLAACRGGGWPCRRRIPAGRAGDCGLHAALVTARSETATTRNLANAARLLAENPALMRLREMQSLVEVAREPGNTVVLTLPQALLTALGRTNGE